MKHFLPSLIRKAAAALLLTAAGSLPMLADGTIPYRASFDNAQMRYSSKGEYSKIKSTDIATYGEIGAPALPVRTYRFVVPVYTGKFTVSMTLPEKASETVTLDTPVMPVQEPRISGEMAEEKFTIDTKAYNKVYSPEAWVVDDHFVDGSNHIVTVAVMPVEYNPVASTMKYYPYVDIKLNYADVAETEMSSRPVFTKHPNPNLDLSKIAVNGEKPRRSSYSGSGTVSAGTYIIISPIEYISAFKELAEWKRNKGYTVKLDTLDKILARYPNGDVVSGINDDAGKLRAYLIDCFDKYGRSYVLLAGDYHSNFPIRMAYCFTSSKDTIQNYNPTDVYFSDMTGNWDANSNRKYGEFRKDSINFYPDMIVGRLLCKNAQEVENYTRKLMLYERNPGLGDYAYLSKGFVSIPNQSFGQSGFLRYYNDHIKNHYKQKFTSVREMISNDDDTLYKADRVIAEMNKGYGLNVLEGHGQPHNIVISKPDKDRHYRLWAKDEYNDQPTVETNVGFDKLYDITKPSLLFTVSCTTTPFDRYESEYYTKEYNLGAAYTVAGLYGGVSYTGYTRAAWSGYDEKDVGMCIKNLENGTNIGYAFAMAKYQRMRDDATDPSAYENSLRNALIGDPEMNVWTQAPRNFNITGGTLNFDGSATFNSTEIPGAIVTVSDGQNILSRTMSYFNTSVSIPYVTDCSVTFTKPGCLPQSLLFIDDSSINDTRTYFMTSGTISGTEIGYGGMVTIYASGDVVLDNSFKVLSNGRLQIITDGNVWLKHGMLDTGGLIDLKVRGQIIINSTNFRIKSGSFFRQSHIQ